MSVHVVYRMYDRDGCLLYIGCTGDLPRRLQQHRRTKAWFDDIYELRTEPYPNVSVARAVELAAIKSEGARHNVLPDESARNGWATRKRVKDGLHARGYRCQDASCRKCGHICPPFGTRWWRRDVSCCASCTEGFMNQQQSGETRVRRCWLFEDQFGAEAPKDADPRDLVAEWLTYAADMTLDDCTADEIDRLVAAVRYTPLFSVVKADHWNIDPDECGGFHSDASGKRVMEAWFIDKALIYAVEGRFLKDQSGSRSEP